MLREENFTAADRSLAAALKVDPDHDEARRLRQTIDVARRDVVARVKTARHWIELEWFEPAFIALRQAGALLPDRKHEWAEAYRAASVGAGDDHYFTKSFQEAFYYYDAAIKLGEQLGAPAAPSMASRWLQCMIHALGETVGQTPYPPAYWSAAIARARDAGTDFPGAAQLQAVLEGLAYENMELDELAARQYALALGRKATAPATAMQRLREETLRAVRRFYDRGLSDRRNGRWAEIESDEWKLRESPRFAIHHRNALAAERVEAALQFHLRRIADLLALDLDEIPWAIPCEVHLYANAGDFRQAMRQPEHVRGISVLRAGDGELQGHAIHVSQDDPHLLSSTLAHELAHLVVAAVTDYRPFRPVLNEGIALSIEPQCRQRQFARLFRDLDKPRSIASLLAIGEVHPPDPDYYAEAHRLTSVLLAKGDMNTALAAGVDAKSARSLANIFGLAGEEALETAFRGRRN